MLICDNVTKRYGGKPAVNHLSLTIEPGHTVALLGPNGSGKSTLMKMITGLTRPDEGTITFEGIPVGKETKRRIAYMPTEAFFYGYMTAEDAGRYYEDFFDDFSVSAYKTMMGEMNLDMNQRLSKMSSGMVAKQKIALTLARDADFVMLDEPLNGIDIIARDQIIDHIRRHMADTKSFLLSSHLVDELERVIDYAVFMKEGDVLLQGNAMQLRQERGMNLTDMYRYIYG